MRIPHPSSAATNPRDVTCNVLRLIVDNNRSGCDSPVREERDPCTVGNSGDQRASTAAENKVKSVAGNAQDMVPSENSSVVTSGDRIFQLIVDTSLDRV